MNFSSENFDCVHPKILEGLIRSNKHFVPSYGNDEYTKNSQAKFAEVLGRKDIDVFFCFNGTGANNFALSSITDKNHSILCADVSHVYNAESTAPEAFTGCRLYPLQSKDGKILVDDLIRQLTKKDGVHYPLAATLTISQPTEYGTLYNEKELKEIASVCNRYHIMLHVDGARIFNALDAMQCSFPDFVKISEVDALTIGGTKSGLMFGEAVIFFGKDRFKNIAFNHKRSMQLASKNRYIAVQFEELLKKQFWKNIAAHTNSLAKYFEKQVSVIDPLCVVYPVQTNMVFMKMKPNLFSKLRSKANFYMWDKEKHLVRFVFSFGNTKNEIDAFVKMLIAER